MDRSIHRLGFGRAFASRRCWRLFLALAFGLVGALGMGSVQATLCGGVTYPFPYTDVSGVGAPFCPGIMEAYVTGVTKGTTPTTFSPNDNVSRLQMTTFLQRSLDQGLTRASRRTVLKQLWKSPATAFGAVTTGLSIFCAADGDNIWVANQGTVDQVQASTGKVVNTWTGATASWAVLPIPGLVVVAGNGTPGQLWFIDPKKPPGALSAGLPLPGGPSAIAYDGASVWIADFSGQVSIYPLLAGGLTNVSTGFVHPVSVLYDGTQIWVTDYGAGKLFAVDPLGNITQTVNVGAGPEQSVFDGENIWVPNSLDNSITVVQASTAKVIATIVSDGVNKLSGPEQAAFDGERILVTNSTGMSLSTFKAADLSLIANTSINGYLPYGACSDGINFWISVSSNGVLLKF
jgi:hypothetical protein